MTVENTEIEYQPGFIARFARVILPILYVILPKKAYKSIYETLYTLNKRRIWLFYNLFTIGDRFSDKKEKKLKQDLIRKLLPFTMGGPKALGNAFDSVLYIKTNNIEGDIVECGVAQGGTAAMLGLATMELESNEKKRKFWFFDSYEGLPKPTDEDYEGTSAGKYVQPLEEGSCLGTIEQVGSLLINKCKIPAERVTLVKGWFQDTVFSYQKKIKQIAILRLDGDWYESTKVPLQAFYPNVSNGGVIIIDDYATCYGSKKAVLEYLNENNISVKLQADGRGGAWFVKP